jgi:hypothetical protein
MAAQQNGADHGGHRAPARSAALTSAAVAVIARGTEYGRS